ncbi:MAG: spiro-SPASM protein [Treponema sp.]|nr:spiro-SPASM protein [Treponema sp.]
MNALLVLYGGELCDEAFATVFNGKNSFSLALERSKSFPGVGKIILLADQNRDFSGFSEIQVERQDSWTKFSLLKTISELSQGFDFVYYAWTDCPFLDPALAGAIARRHVDYAADYSYADGWPLGIAPEIISPQTSGILANILGSDDGKVGRDTLFSVIQKDINAFDIETEISPVDLRCHRISLCADSRRNLLLLNRFASEAGAIPDAAQVQRIIEEKPEVLRTLPAFFPVQVYGGCPQSCALCPYPVVSKEPVTGRKDHMDGKKFELLLDKIIAFSGDAVIDLSLWGELSLHPDKMDLIDMVISRPELALIIETSGIGWKSEELEKCASLAQKAEAAGARKSRLPPLSWILSLDAFDPVRYKEMRGQGFAEAIDCAKKLFALLPKNTYVQAVRTAGAEDDIEKFYRSWKEAAPMGDANIIVQKYDDFCGFLDKKQASDISPVIRKPCWHIMRDMPVLIDGTVPLCREELEALKEHGGEGSRTLGNVFTDSLEKIWEAGLCFYIEQCGKNYSGFCTACDEYYTYNF